MIQIALFVVAFISLMLALFVFLNNPRSILFKLYFLFGLTSAMWMFVNAIVVNSPIGVGSNSLLLFYSRLITPFSIFALLCFLFFLKEFRKSKITFLYYVLLLMSFVVIAFSLTRFNVYLDKGQLALGALYPFYLATLCLNIYLIFYTVFAKTNLKKNSREYSQLKSIRMGVVLTAIPLILIGSVLPIFSDSNISNLGPLFAIIFLIYAALAIVKYKLFDLRLVVTRTLAYLTLFTILIGVFTLATYIVSNVLFSNSGVDSNLVRGVYTVFAIVLALLFPRFKKLFDKYTNKIFYRDAYDSQELLDRFNKMLVETFKVPLLIQEGSKIIVEDIKPSFIIFKIHEMSNTPERIYVGGSNSKIEDKLFKKIDDYVNSARTKIIVIDEISEKYRDIKQTLVDNNVTVIAKLSNNAKEKGTGYILFGAKKSGNNFTAQDLNVIEIINNELVIALQNALRFEEIENFNITLQDKVTEATAKLRSANEKLKALDETKDDFISMASHQLRTPLTSVKGYLSMVLEGDAGKLTRIQKEMLGQAFFSSQRMVYLISDLLNVSRLKTGKFIIEPVPLDLSELVQQELGQLQETAGSRSLKLEFNKPKDFPKLMLDETKTRQVIMNFTDNAIYYTPAGGVIKVVLEDNPQTIELKVIDNGIGVPKSEQHHLFTKFYRAGNARKARPDGTGLGLFMAKKVILAEGGSVIFESEEGKGSTFGFIFSKSKIGVNPTK